METIYSDLRTTQTLKEEIPSNLKEINNTEISKQKNNPDVLFHMSHLPTWGC